jgi:hypothetical protein
VSGLTPQEHRQVQDAARRQRNAAARARRAGPVHLVRVLRSDGTIVLAAQSRSEPGAAYELTRLDSGGWACTCRGYRFRGTCAHLEAVDARARGPPVLPSRGAAMVFASTTDAARAVSRESTEVEARSHQPGEDQTIRASHP